MHKYNFKIKMIEMMTTVPLIHNYTLMTVIIWQFYKKIKRNNMLWLTSYLLLLEEKINLVWVNKNFSNSRIQNDEYNYCKKVHIDV